MIILCFGDSITQGFWDIEGGWVQRIRKDFDQQSIEQLDTIPDEDVVSVFNLGIQGETTSQLLRRIEAETIARKLPGEKIVAVVALGTNDDGFSGNVQSVPPEQFAANMEHIVAKLAVLVDAIILLGNPACDESRTTPVSWGDYSYTNTELERSEAAIAHVAAAHNLRYVPMFDSFKTELDAGKRLLADGLHPNGAGHEHIAAQLRPVLLATMQELKPKHR